VDQVVYLGIISLLAVGLGLLRFASHPRFRVRGRLPDPPRAQQLRRLIHRAMLGSSVGLALVLVTAAADWPRAVHWAGAGLAVLGWLVTAATLPLLVRVRAARGSSRRTPE